ncbi:hypothetical protein [Bacillus sp. Marseille-P3800]|uniref:hypothetical protein n=1 Tax=Bacillus sp. Marseille-P3800 TaxID=2014782 RepID=UPI0011452053|nr:hypothetical protein [Bacillus sp. Marseille-P3800]
MKQLKHAYKVIGTLLFCVVMAYLFSLFAARTGSLLMLMILSLSGVAVGCFVLLQLIKDHVDTEA